MVAAGAAGFLLRGLANPGVAGDGVGYYAPLASLAFDGDLDLGDELANVSPQLLRAAFMTPDGRLGDPFPVGPALLWAPGVLLARLLPPQAALDAPLRKPLRTLHPGFAPRFARAVLYTSALEVLLGGALLAAVLAPDVGVLAAAAGPLAAALGTPAFFYALADPSYGHAATFFSASLLLALALRDRRRRLPLALLGAAWGLAALVRWQDVLLGLLLAPRLLDEWRACRGAARSLVRAALRFGLPALLVFAPQMLFWWRIYGTPLLRPPGAEFVPFWRPAIAPLLLSTWNGAFVWSPLLLVGFVGLSRLPDRRLLLAAFAAVVIEVYVSALVLDWWGGRAFGARRLVSLAPLAALGIAYLLRRFRASPWRLAALAALLVAGCLWSERLAQYNVRGLLPANPGSAADYVRQYAPGSAHAQRYGLWDYPRLVSEAVESERMLRIDARRRAASARPHD